MIKLIPNDMLAIQMYSTANSIDSKMSFSKEYLLHDNIFFMLGEPFSLGFDMVSKKVSKCKPRSEVKVDFKDAYQLKFQALPSAMINMIGNAFNQWLGISHYDNAGVYSSLNAEGNRQLKPHNLQMELNNSSLTITHYENHITYEAAVKYLLLYDVVSAPSPSIQYDNEEPDVLKRKGVLSKMHDSFMEGFNKGFDKTTIFGDSPTLDIIKEKGILGYFKECALKGFYGDDYNKRTK